MVVNNLYIFVYLGNGSRRGIIMCSNNKSPSPGADCVTKLNCSGDILSFSARTFLSPGPWFSIIMNGVFSNITSISLLESRSFTFCVMPVKIAY